MNKHNKVIRSNMSNCRKKKCRKNVTGNIRIINFHAPIKLSKTTSNAAEKHSNSHNNMNKDKTKCWIVDIQFGRPWRVRPIWVN